MIFLLNIIPWVILVGSFLISFYTRKFWIILAGLVVFFLYTSLQPSYLPKGEVERAKLPEFEQSNKEITDRLSKPQSGDEYDRKRQESYKEIDRRLEERNKQ